MAFGQPKRNSKNPCCGRQGKCSCQRSANAAVERKPDALVHCTRMCGWNGQNKACGRLARNGVCPCPNC